MNKPEFNDMRDKLRETLAKLMQEHRISEAELCRQTGIPHPTLNRLMSRATDDPRILTIRPLARFFKVSIDQLIGDEPLASIRQSGNHSLVPLLSWEQVPIWETTLKTLKTEHIDNWKNWIAMSIPVSENAYALQIQQRTLGMPFPYGTHIVIEPHLKAQDGDFVIVQDIKSNSVSLKQYLIDGKKVHLTAPNQNVKTILMDKNYKLSGVIIQAELTFHRN